jgi:hypothetical protein
LGPLVQYGWNVAHMYMVTAFLNPKINQENIHMETPVGIDWLKPNMPDGSILVLQKVLHGLKEAHKLWFEDINGFLQSIGFHQFAKDLNLYLQSGVLLILSADDLLIAYDGTDRKRYGNKCLLQAKYKRCDLRVARRFIGIEIEREKMEV